jgi:hypothetical protein
MSVETKPGQIVVDSKGNTVYLTAVDTCGEMLPNGSVPVFDGGIVLRGISAEPTSFHRIRKGGDNAEPVRIVCTMADLINLAESSGLDLKTSAAPPLTPLERLEQLERENAQLKTKLCEFDEQPKPQQPSQQWEASDGTPGKAAEPQPLDRRFQPVKLELGGSNSPRIVFNNPGAKA